MCPPAERPLTGNRETARSDVHKHDRAPTDSCQAGNNCRNVLFVCDDNSVCSILAEAILNRWGGKSFRGFSAGTRPAQGVSPHTIDLLKAQGLWRQSLCCKGCDEFRCQDAQPMNFVISIGEQTPAGLPVDWTGNPRMMHWHISKPIVDGKPAETALSIRRTFRELENRVKLMVLVYERDGLNKAAA